MSEPGWAIPVFLAVLGGFMLLAGQLDAAFAARASGRRLSGAILLEPVRETARLLATQRSATPLPDATTWRLGIVLVPLAAVGASAVIPLSDDVVVSDLIVGVVWWLSLLTLLWIGVHLIGWGSNSHLPLIGAYRFLAQAFAYAMPLSLVVLTIAAIAGSLRVSEIVAAQGELWFVVWAPVGFAIYVVSVLALAFWGPFETPTATDVASGAGAELSGPDRLVLYAGRYAALVSAAAFAVPLFLGGGSGPLLPGWAWIAIKTALVLALLVAARWLLPRIPIDRFEEPAWALLIPAILVQILLAAGIVIAIT